LNAGGGRSKESTHPSKLQKGCAPTTRKKRTTGKYNALWVEWRQLDRNDQEMGGEKPNEKKGRKFCADKKTTPVTCKRASKDSGTWVTELGGNWTVCLAVGETKIRPLKEISDGVLKDKGGSTART